MLGQIRLNKSQEEVPPHFGEYISLAKAEPLHCTNNAWGAVFKLLLQEAFNWTRLPSTIKLLQQMPEECILVRFVRALKKKVSAHRLHKKLCKHLSGEDTHEKFKYRFSGHDSRDLCTGFHHPITTLEKGADDFRLHAIVLATKQLRKVTTLMSRVHVTPDQLATLKKKSCKVFFNTMALFFGQVTPTTWTIGHTVPVHTQQLFDEFGFGLGLDSMQGREAKKKPSRALVLCERHAERSVGYVQHSSTNSCLTCGCRHMTCRDISTPTQTSSGSPHRWNCRQHAVVVKRS